MGATLPYPDAVLAALDRHGVRALIIGSLAAAMQGVDLPLTDIDLVPELSESNVPPWPRRSGNWASTGSGG